MTARLVLLGTAGGPRIKPGRAAPAQAVVVGDRFYVVDAGNGVARQAVRAGLDPRQLGGVFITHHHSDHNVDVVTLPLLAWASGLSTRIPLAGPPPLGRMVTQLVAANATDIDFRMRGEQRPDFAGLLDVSEISAPGLVFQDDRIRLSAAVVDHGLIKPALAFRIDTEHRSYVISGDTRPCDALVELALGADVLVHEVLYRPALDLLVSETNAQRLEDHLLDTHTPVEQVGEIAQRAQVGTLVLSHLIPSYPEVPEQTWVQEASKGFAGEVRLGHDLMVIE